VRNQIPAFRKHLLQHVGLKEASVNLYILKIQELIKWMEGNAYETSPEAITRKRIEEYLEWCFRQRNSNVTRRTKLVALRRFFTFLLYDEIIQADPSLRIPLPRPGKRNVRIFTQDEVLRIFQTCSIETEKGLRDVAIFILAAFGGLRASEICDLKIENLIEDGDNFYLQVENSKFGESRIITNIWKIPRQFLTAYISFRLTAHGAGPGSPLLVSYRRGGKVKGHKLTEGALDQLLKKLAGLSQIRKSRVNMHMFRSSHATDLRKIEGWEVESIAKRLGHANIQTTADNYFGDWNPVRKKFASLAAYWKRFNLKLWIKEGAIAEG